MLIVLFDGVSIASAQDALGAHPRALAWFVAGNGAVHDVAAADVLAHETRGEYVPARPAIFPSLEQALDTMPVEDPTVVLLLEDASKAAEGMLQQRGIPFRRTLDS